MQSVNNRLNKLLELYTDLSNIYDSLESSCTNNTNYTPGGEKRIEEFDNIIHHIKTDIYLVYENDSANPMNYCESKEAQCMCRNCNRNNRNCGHCLFCHGEEPTVVCRDFIIRKDKNND